MVVPQKYELPLVKMYFSTFQTGSEVVNCSSNTWDLYVPKLTQIELGIRRLNVISSGRLHEPTYSVCSIRIN